MDEWMVPGGGSKERRTSSSLAIGNEKRRQNGRPIYRTRLLRSMVDQLNLHGGQVRRAAHRAPRRLATSVLAFLASSPRLTLGSCVLSLSGAAAFVVYRRPERVLSLERERACT